VEDALFRVPRHVLETSSEVFRDMFLLPVGVGSAEGKTDRHPVVLEGVSSHTFKLLLKVLLKFSYSMDAWTAVLKLSDQWGMSSVRKFVLRNLNSKESMLGPLEKAGLALELDIKRWLVPSLEALARREEPLSRVEVERLGIEAVLKLAEVRESLIARKYGGVAVGKREAKNLNFREKIREVFRQELTE
ncbi:hypothetical protein CONPUDRAFT_57507, partial [Coniophora puteana RWD-64-598 SS2]